MVLRWCWRLGRWRIFENGVNASADNSYGLAAMNNSSADTILATNENATGNSFQAFNGKTFLGCSIDANGNLLCNRSKNAVVPIDGGKRKVALAAIESPKNWF